MRLSDLKEDQQLDEFLPAVGAAVGGAAKAVGSAIGGAAKAVGGALKTGAAAAGKLGQQVGQQAAVGQQAGLAGGGMDPAQAAAAAKERMDQKKQVQDQIKQTEQQLNDLRKQLAELG
jgi:hypothetical protein